MEPVGRHLMSTDHVTDLGGLCLKKDRNSGLKEEEGALGADLKVP